MPTYNPDGTIRLDTEMNVGHVGPEGAGQEGNIVYSDQWFRDSFEALEGLQADRGYDHYEPAFRYGWHAAHRHRDRDWAASEAELERDWRERNADRDWRDYRSAVRHAFERAMHVFEGGPDPDRRR